LRQATLLSQGDDLLLELHLRNGVCHGASQFRISLQFRVDPLNEGRSLHRLVSLRAAAASSCA